MNQKSLAVSIQQSVQLALEEDLGPINRDFTAELIAPDKTAHAQLICREQGILCGQAWAEEVFRQLGGQVELTWLKKDGDSLSPNDTLLTLSGDARSILTGERTAMNFIQTLSACATITSRFAEQLTGTRCQLLDTRKTIPGLRLAQKYAVTVGGGQNHRIGLFDAFLIKENHIAAAGSITAAVNSARNLNSSLKLEVEVESIDELNEALEAGADYIMLDNFSLDMMNAAVKLNQQQSRPAKLEASGDVTLATIRSIAETGVDFISVGALTKHISALDLSLRVNLE
ncbi:carboxylating nicotinate-nucleotide diphosphorylase [Pleionea litopenaei]|uniref:Probable nicotinate-nucleotide pyrophosphorylase [carboxylating] n=1 Tax=Pleionea litopenaei TaxID=3070815 RepID=A0AA51X7W4_9GAMM|nr:carboxylating nicotinate-nucleotide diphosphorylase [Pleionea sp. HL-JVS1]WMS88658.1 carboxylating nicotinate-nucleotide diphosphorylase [Pleionea sp. HL-JVS1]